MQHASTTLQKIFRETLKHERDNPVLLAWPLACGSKIAARTDAVGFSEGVLTVSVPDLVWRAQLQNFAGQYLTALNQVTSEQVRRIEFVVAATGR